MTAQTRGRRHRLLTDALVTITVTRVFARTQMVQSPLFEFNLPALHALSLLLGCPS